jgi:two-component system, chemotaxis family, sensor kinase CheA
MSVFGDSQELVQEFAETSLQELLCLEEVLSSLKEGRATAEDIFSIYKAFHTLKGTSGFLDFGKLGDLAGTAERVTICLRDDICPWAPAMEAPLMKAGLSIRSMLNHILEHGDEGDDTYEELTQELLHLDPQAEEKDE